MKLRILFLMLFLLSSLSFCLLLDVMSGNKTVSGEDIEYFSVVENIPIAALSDKTLTEGSYQFMLKSAKDGKMLYFKLKAEGTYYYPFKPGTDEPHLSVKIRMKKVNGEVSGDFGTFISEQSDYENLHEFCDNYGYISSVTLYVPEGTIEKSFDANFNN